MQLKTKERMQLQDDFFVDAYKKPTDKRLKDFKVGKLVTFMDRQDECTGVVGGFSMSDVEQVWVRSLDAAEHTRHRADEVEIIKEIVAPKPKSAKKQTKKK